MIRARTPEEQRARIVGAAEALEDVQRVGLAAALDLWRPFFELELDDMEQETKA